MTDFRALCAELLKWAEHTSAHYVVYPDVILRARTALAQPKPVAPTDEELWALTAPTLMERAMAGDAIAAKQFLYEANFTDEHGQWLPQYQPISETTND
jgi:hypothetical protein